MSRVNYRVKGRGNTPFGAAVWPWYCLLAATASKSRLLGPSPNGANGVETNRRESAAALPLEFVTSPPPPLFVDGISLSCPFSSLVGPSLYTLPLQTHVSLTDLSNS